MSVKRRQWYIFTPHGFVLLALARFGDLTVEELASKIDYSRWSVLRTLRNLEEAGMVRVVRDGRRNRYVINPRAKFYNPLLEDHTIGELLLPFQGEGEGAGAVPS
jgi:DNA-binding transcriptional ArsR family regulator